MKNTNKRTPNEKTEMHINGQILLGSRVEKDKKEKDLNKTKHIIYYYCCGFVSDLTYSFKSLSGK